jgi:hypothetical protein
MGILSQFFPEVQAESPGTAALDIPSEPCIIVSIGKLNFGCYLYSSTVTGVDSHDNRWFFMFVAIMMGT